MICPFYGLYTYPLVLGLLYVYTLGTRVNSSKLKESHWDVEENDFLGQGVPKIAIKRNNHNKKIFGSIHLKNFVNKRLNVCLEVFCSRGFLFKCFSSSSSSSLFAFLVFLMWLVFAGSFYTFFFNFLVWCLISITWSRCFR